MSCLAVSTSSQGFLWAEWSVCYTQLERTWKLPAGNAERATRDRNCQYPLAGLCAALGAPADFQVLVSLPVNSQGLSSIQV